MVVDRKHVKEVVVCEIRCRVYSCDPWDFLIWSGFQGFLGVFSMVLRDVRILLGGVPGVSQSRPGSLGVCERRVSAW